MLSIPLSPFHFLILLVLVAAQPANAPLHISGRVTDVQGKPIQANIYIVAANCRPEFAPNCPVEPPAVGTSALTNSEGGFALADLDSRFNYTIAIGADHYKAQSRLGSTDSLEPIVVKLAPQPLKLDDGDTVRGHITEPDGKPVAGAFITLVGERSEGEHRYGGSIQKVDHYALSATDGVFTLSADKSGRQFDVLIQHPRYAPQIVHPVSGGTSEVTLSRGVVISGRVIKDGRPLRGVQVMLTGVDTHLDRNTGWFSTGTDAEGKFSIEHVPESDEYRAFATMQSLGNRGCCRPVQFKVDTADMNVGDLNVESAVTVSGTILLPEGKKIPSGATAVLSTENGIDSASVKVAPDGSFKFIGVPTGTVQLEVHAKGFDFSPDNSSYFANYHSMVGRVNGDTTLRIKLEEADAGKTQTYLNRPGPLEPKLLAGVPDEGK